MTAQEKLTLKDVHHEIQDLTQRFDRLITNVKWGIMALISFVGLIIICFK